MIRRYVKMYDRVPFWYGEAWYDYPTRRTVCYPIPLNWLAWAIYTLNYKLFRVPQTKIDEVFRRAEKEGRECGYIDGFNTGKADMEAILQGIVDQSVTGNAPD